jgi:hypothetical protein
VGRSSALSLRLQDESDNSTCGSDQGKFAPGMYVPVVRKRAEERDVDRFGGFGGGCERSVRGRHLFHRLKTSY